MEAVTNVYQGVFGATEYKKFLGFVDALKVTIGSEKPLEKKVQLPPGKYTVNLKYEQKGANVEATCEVIPPEVLKVLTDILEANNFKEDKEKTTTKIQILKAFYNLNDITQLELYVKSKEALDTILEKQSDGSWLLPKEGKLTVQFLARYNVNEKRELVAKVGVAIDPIDIDSILGAYLKHYCFKAEIQENKQPAGTKKEGIDANIPPPAEAVGKVPEVKNPAAPASSDNVDGLKDILTKLQIPTEKK